MNNNEIQQAIKDYLLDIIHMSAASVGEDGKPWAWEVHFAYDDDMNLYWASVMGARHSQEIVKNANIAGTIVVQHQAEDAPRGVSFEGTAKMVEDVNEESPEFKVYAGRYPKRGEFILEGYDKDDSDPKALRLFKINVSDWYMAAIVEGKLAKLHLKRG
jgi:uncharacterized protein YhbP (UPF0306 family)